MVTLFFTPRVLHPVCTLFLRPAAREVHWAGFRTFVTRPKRDVNMLAQGGPTDTCTTQQPVELQRSAQAICIADDYANQHWNHSLYPHDKLLEVRAPRDPAGPLARMLITAPHGVYLLRDGHPVHKSEHFVSYLAQCFATHIGAVSLTWSDYERRRSRAERNPNPQLRDPNFLHVDELNTNPWFQVLKRHATLFGQDAFHVDLHGRQDHDYTIGNDPSDCDIGLGALQTTLGPHRAQQLRSLLAHHLREALSGTEYTVNENPRLAGHTGLEDRLTMAQQGVLLGMTSVQLELTSRLRHWLATDHDARCAFAHALGLAARAFFREEETVTLSHTAFRTRTPHIVSL
eukprot:comp19225_c0_seq1/m.21987 comp19225_c0_seq1/g.21987  ORF comp19225_c0_seq1/g.21987 comp19225_c0_seq1/m.21987 type:complete len:345 (-) comp19225_c0_seq1:27-1061(-)